MVTILNYLLEASVLLFLAWVIYILLLEPQRTLQFRRIFLLASAIISLTIPYVHLEGLLVSPDGSISGILPGIFLSPVIIGGIDLSSTQSISFDWPHAFSLVYAIGVFGAVALVLIKMTLLARIVRQGSFMHKDDSGSIFINSQGSHAIFSFFNIIVLNDKIALSSWEKSQIIEHEKVHIRHGHSYDVLLFEILTTVLWFHPISWILKKKVLENHEYIVDNTMIQATNQDEYRRLLAKMSLSNVTGLPIIANHFSKILTLKRLEMIGNSHKRKLPLQSVAAGIFLVLCALLLSCNKNFLEETGTDQNVLSREQIPAPLGEVMDRLEQTYPGINFEYHELDDNPDSKNLAGQLVGKHVQYSHRFEDRAKIGVISFPEDQFHLMAELSKSKLNAYTMVDDAPEPLGGMQAFYEYIGKNIKYPEEAARIGTEGRVLISFVVDKNGSLTNIEAVEGIGHGCDAEAMRVIRSSPKWQPGLLDGQPVNVKIVLPITFKLTP